MHLACQFRLPQLQRITTQLLTSTNARAWRERSKASVVISASAESQNWLNLRIGFRKNGPIIGFTPPFGTAFAISPTATDCLGGLSDVWNA